LDSLAGVIDSLSMLEPMVLFETELGIDL